MEICDNCNSEIEKDSVYCNKCGHKVNPSLLDNHVTLYSDFGGLSIPFNPLTFEYCFQIGINAYHKGDYYESLEYDKKAVTFHNLDLRELSNCYNEIGCSYVKIGQRDKGIEYFQLAISANPENKDSWMNLIAQQVSNDDNGAIENFKKMESIIVDFDSRVWHLIGMAYENLNRYDSAKKFYEEAIKNGYEKAKVDLDDVVRKISNLKM